MAFVAARHVDRVAGFVGFESVAHADGVAVAPCKQAGDSGSHIERQGLFFASEPQQVQFSGQPDAVEVGLEVAIDVALHTAVRLWQQAGIGLFPQHPGIEIVEPQTIGGVEVEGKTRADLRLGSRYRFGAGSFDATALNPRSASVETKAERSLCPQNRREGQQ